MTTIILGWDGLDYQLLDEFGLTYEFGDYISELETYKNPIIGKPHTREVWPTLITGLGPDEHGIRAATEDEGVKWSNPKLQLASRLAQHTVPDSIKKPIGRMLRSSGVEVEKYDESYYDGMWTIFDDRSSFPIAVPNYWTDTDEYYDFMFDRGAELSRFLDRGPDGWKTASPKEQRTVEREMFSELGTKIGLLRNLLQYDYDLIWLWDGLVDTAGHVEPVAHHPLQERAYETYANVTGVVEDLIEPDDTLVCVSDHGLRGGDHTMDAMISSNDQDVVDAIDSVYDVAGVIDDITGNTRTDPELRGSYENMDTGVAENVGENLEDLGYI